MIDLLNGLYKGVCRISTLILFSSVLAKCSPSFKGNDSIAEVNGHKIFLEDYLRVRDSFKLGELIEISAQTKESSTSTRNTILKHLIRRFVLLSEAEKRGLQVSDSEVSEFISKSKLNEALPPDAKEELLLERRITNDSWLKNIREDLLIEKLLQSQIPTVPKPSLTQMLASYERRSDEFQKPASVEAVIAIVSSAEIAESLREKLKGSREALQDFIKSNSLDINLDVQTVYQGSLDPELDKALFQIRAGSISTPLKLAYGFAVIRVLKIKPSLNLSFDQVKNQISADIMAETRLRLIESQQESWIREATIRYNRSLIAGL